MNIQAEVHFQYTLSELCQVCELEQSWVIELIENEIVDIKSGTDILFDQYQVGQVMKAKRLHNDLGLNTPGVALVMQLLEQIAEQQKELDLLQRQFLKD